MGHDPSTVQRVALFVVLAGQAALADTVVLRNGLEYKGLVTEESDVTVCVATGACEVAFSRSESPSGPVLDLGGRVVDGFDQGAIDAILDGP